MSNTNRNPHGFRPGDIVTLIKYRDTGFNAIHGDHAKVLSTLDQGYPKLKWLRNINPNRVKYNKNGDITSQMNGGYDLEEFELVKPRFTVRLKELKDA